MNTAALHEFATEQAPDIIAATLAEAREFAARNHNEELANSYLLIGTIARVAYDIVADDEEVEETVETTTPVSDEAEPELSYSERMKERSTAEGRQLGRRLAKERDRREMSREEIAEAWGVHVSTYDRLEKHGVAGEETMAIARDWLETPASTGEASSNGHPAAWSDEERAWRQQVGDVVRQARHDAGLTQWEVGVQLWDHRDKDSAQAGMSSIERAAPGVALADTGLLDRLSSILGVQLPPPPQATNGETRGDQEERLPVG